MAEIIKSATFDRWLKKLQDPGAKVRIEMRIRRLGLGNPGDVRPIGDGLSEMRIDYGSGYRVYYVRQGSVFVRWRQIHAKERYFQGQKACCRVEMIRDG